MLRVERKANLSVGGRRRCIGPFGGDREARYLGLGLANLINLFTPDAIVLSGSIMKSSNLFLPGIRETIRQGCHFVPFEKAQLLLASLGENANLIGAAMVWHHRFGTFWSERHNLTTQSLAERNNRDSGPI